MMQPSFDLAEIITRCGDCVHLNGRPDGYCTPVGRRRGDDKPCAWAFPMTQLRLSLYGKAQGGRP